MKKNLLSFIIVLFSIGNILNAQSTLIVANGTATSVYLPVYGYMMDDNQHDQFIYPMTEVGPLSGSSISKITFHSNSTTANSNWGAATCIISLGTTSQSNYETATYDLSSLTQVYSGPISVVNGIMEFTLTTPYLFTGGNLLVDIITITSGIYSNVTFSGITANNGGICQYGTNAKSLKHFLPKMTALYTGVLPVVVTSPPTSINATSATLNGAYYNMTSSNFGFQYLLATSSDWTTATTVTANSNPMSTAISSLIPNTTYRYRAFANDGATSYYGNELTFILSAQIPYACDFENPAENTQWTFINGTQTNKFFIGNATQNPAINNTLGGANALYISNDGGPTWAYSGTGTSTSSYVYAYRDFEVPAGVSELKLDFDWIANGGVAAYEFLRVYWMPVNIPVNAGQMPPTVNTINYDFVAMIGNYTNGYGSHWLSRQTTWQHAQFTINSIQFPNLAGNNWRLYVHWRNNQTTAVQPPATFDNMTLVVSNCPTLRIDSVSNVSSNSADVYFTEMGTATAWNIQYKPSNASTWTTVQVTTNPTFIAGLNMSTTYQFRIQSDCGTEQSVWSPIISKATTCGTITQFPWGEGFEVPTSWPAAIAPGNASAQTCWLNFNGQVTTGLWRRTSSAAYVHSGSGAAQEDAYSSNQLHNDFLITPPISLTGSQRLKFWAKGYSASYPERLKVAIYDITTIGHDLTSMADTTLFVEILPNTLVSGTTWTEYEIYLNQFVGDYRIAFIRNTIGGYYLNLDDILIDNLPSCLRPSAVSVSNITPYGATISWTSINGTENQWEVSYKPTASTQWNSLIVSNTPICTLSPLTFSTPYDVKVRTICGIEDTSSYTTVKNFITTPNICTVPNNLSVSNISNESTTISWTAGGTDSLWELSYKLASESIWTIVNLDTTIFQLTSLSSCSDYNVRVRSICSSGVFTNYTTVANFTTPVPLPTNIQISTLNSNSATINWNANMAYVQSIVEWKRVSSSYWFNSGILNDDSYQINNLHTNSEYEIRIKNICNSTQSNFTLPITYTTPDLEMYNIFMTTSNSNNDIYCGDSIQLNAKTTYLEENFKFPEFNNSFFLNSNTFFLACSNGKILKTNTGGRVFDLINTNTNNTISSIFFVDSLKGYAVGYKTILKSIDGGNTWNILMLDSIKIFRSVFFTNENDGYVVGKNNCILKTTDGGSNWISSSTIPQNLNSTFNMVYFKNSDTGFVVGTAGAILKTTNAGQTWIKINNDSTTIFNSIKFIDNNIGFILGDKTLLKTSNGGITWDTISSPALNLKTIFFKDSMNGFLMASNKIYKSTNQGDSWELLNGNVTNGSPLDLYFDNQNNGFSLYTSGLFKSTNEGSLWNLFCKGYGVTAICSTDSLNVYATCGVNILKTVDAGNSWKIFSPGLPYDISNMFSITFVDSLNGFAACNNGNIIKTTDGGFNWTFHTTGSSAYFWTMCFVNENVGYIAGGNGTIMKTIDGGNSWIPIPTGETNTDFLFFNTIYFLNENVGFVGTASGELYKTINGGLNWNIISINDPIYISQNFSFNTMVFTDSLTGYIAGYGGILKTIDMGESWSIILIDSTASNFNDVLAYETFYDDIDFINSNIGYACGPSGFSITTDAGASWKHYFTGQQFRVVSMQKYNEGFITASNNLYKFSEKDSVNYNWIPSNGLNNPNISNPIAHITNNTTYYVNISTNNNTYLDSINLVVNQINISTNDFIDIVCGDSIPLNASTSSNNSNYFFQWSTNGNILLSSANPKVAPLDTTVYFVTLNTNSQCAVTPDSIIINVLPLTIEIGSSISKSCGSIVSIADSLNSNFELINLNYNWFPNIGLNYNNIQNPSTNLVDITYYLNVNTSNGCNAQDSITILHLPINNPGICYLTVDSLNKNKIFWEKPIQLEIDSFFIYKESNFSNIYYKIGVNSYNDPSIFIDLNSNPSIKSEKYKISVLDTCGYESDLSTHHKSVHLTINQGVNNSWNLIWNSYEGKIISSINVYRKVNSVFDPFVLIGTVSGDNNSFTDLNAPQGYVFYQLELILSQPCDDSKLTNSIKSNIATNDPNLINEFINQEISINIYPNPVEKLLYVDIIDETNNGSYNIYIINAQGEQLIQQRGVIGKNIINIEHFSNGIYFVTIISPNIKETRKFLKLY